MESEKEDVFGNFGSRKSRTDLFLVAVELSGLEHPLRSLDLSPSNQRRKPEESRKRRSVEIIAADMTKYSSRVNEIITLSTLSHRRQQEQVTSGTQQVKQIQHRTTQRVEKSLDCLRLAKTDEEK